MHAAEGLGPRRVQGLGEGARACHAIEICAGLDDRRWAGHPCLGARLRQGLDVGRSLRLDGDCFLPRPPHTGWRSSLTHPSPLTSTRPSQLVSPCRRRSTLVLVPALTGTSSRGGAASNRRARSSAQCPLPQALLRRVPEVAANPRTCQSFLRSPCRSVAVTALPSVD